MSHHAATARILPPQGSLFDDRSDAPSIPMAASERGAERATKKRLTVSQAATILQVLAYYGVTEDSTKFFARDRLCQEIPMLSVNAACGRLGPSGALQQDGYIIATEDSARSFAGLVVTGYQITRRGLELIAQARR